jgi:putative sterol carrier protein
MANEVLQKFWGLCAEDGALQNFARRRKMSLYFRITDSGDQFHMVFDNGTVASGEGAPPSSPDLVLSMSSKTLNDLMTGKMHGETAVMSGALYVSDEWKAMDVQGIQSDLARLYKQAAGLS